MIRAVLDPPVSLCQDDLFLCLSSGVHVSLSGCVASSRWMGVAYPDPSESLHVVTMRIHADRKKTQSVCFVFSAYHQVWVSLPHACYSIINCKNKTFALKQGIWSKLWQAVSRNWTQRYSCRRKFLFLTNKEKIKTCAGRKVQVQ